MPLLLLIFYTWVFALQNTAAPPQTCLVQDQKVELSGKLQKVMFAGPPNYESIDGGDQAEAELVVDLTKRICVSGDDSHEEEKGIGTIQLLFKGGAAESERYKPFVLHKVEITGKLVRPQTRHHRTAVLIEVTGMKQVG